MSGKDDVQVDDVDQPRLDDDDETAPPPEADVQVTTTSTKDYLNRALANTIPGTSNATDHLGRNVAAGNKDYLGRGLVA